jgi:hypothetical protein
MKTIHEYLAQKEAKFVQHSFFDKIYKSSSLNKLASLAPRISFWVMTFQDVLRLNEARFTNQKLYKIAQQHRIEDGGHDAWFLNDLYEMNCEEPGLSSLYKSENASVREATYALVSEVFQARNDYERIVLLLTVESTAHVLFKHTAELTERAGYSDVLKYFSYNHLDAEESHESFDDSLEASLDSAQLTQDEKKGIFEVIDRAYEAFTKMYDSLEVTLVPVSG